MANAIHLGPFELKWPLAVGGMGEVWRAVHATQGVPVAVKVLTAQSAREPAYVSAFRHEVRSVGALDHPGIVAVYDHGEVPGEASASQGALQAGSPYLVMELVEGTPLGTSLARIEWEDCRRILLAVLDALAHAHARGVIHRDLKPGNVLRRTADGAIKLSDFGIAHAIDRDRALRLDELPTGTPPYMAPEQITCSWRDYGPWTDLYALGCLGWALVSGMPPFGFSDRGKKDLTWAHLREPPPKLASKISVPLGLEAWLRRLLEKEPGQRYVRAADAAWALFRLGDPVVPPAPRGEDEPTLGELPPLPADSDAVTEATELDSGCVALTFGGLDQGMRTRPAIEARPLTESGSISPPPEGNRPATIPPLPITWKRPSSRHETARLIGVGLGVYGLRPVPLVGRQEERTVLWSLLRQVREEGHAHLALLRGAAGCGKSRLAEWISERGHELGTATGLRAAHGPIGGPAHGLAPMLARHLRCTRMSHAEALDRIGTLLRARGVNDPDEWLALAELVAPSEDDDTFPQRARRIRFRSDTERHALVLRTIARLCDERPVILWLDDVQWGLDALAFAAYLLQTQREQPLPVLLVLTARDEALAEREEEVRLLARLLSRAETQSLEIGPLPAEHRAALVRELLGLDQELAAKVEGRTAGNPLFAVQLVGDWVQRGVLVPGPRGFLLAPGAHAELPADLHAIWIARVDRLLAARPPPDRIALELAAVLGQDVDPQEWRSVCNAAGVQPSGGLLEALFTSRLARSDEGGTFAFVHGMLRESIERGAREAERWRSHHRICAGVLAARGGRGTADRVGTHLVAAGELDAALGPLLAGAAERLVEGDYRLARALLRERERALTQIQHPAASPLWGDGWVLMAQVAREQGDLDEAAELVTRAAVTAEQHDWKHVRAAAQIESAVIARARGQLWTATVESHEAEALAEATGDPRLIAAALRAMGDALRSQGAVAPASECYQRAATAYREQFDQEGWAWCQLGLALCGRLSRRHEETATRASMAREAFEAVGSRRGLASCCNVLGEPARWTARYDDAEHLYREARDHFRAIGAFESVLPEHNLAMVRIAQGRYEEARGILTRVARVCEQRGATLPLGAIELSLLACAAAARDWTEWDARMDRATAILTESGMTDPDLAISARIAADLARAAGERERAREAYAIAAAQLGALGYGAEAAEVQALHDAA